MPSKKSASKASQNRKSAGSAGRKRRSNAPLSEGIRLQEGDVALGAMGESIGFQLRRTGWAVHTSFGRAFSSVHAVPRQYSVLYLIDLNPGVSVNDLAAIIGVDQSTLSATLSFCEDEGWIERKRSPRDRRQVALHITRKGRDMLASFTRMLKDHEDAICAGLSDRERAKLLKLLRKIYDNAQTIGDGG